MNSLSLRALRGPRLRKASTLLLFTSLMLHSLQAAAPGWWTTQGVLKPGVQADDYAIVNLGQLKSVAKKAALEMDARLPGRKGKPIADRLAAWAAAPAPGVTRDDYAAVNLGQLKSVAKLFYDRLHDAELRPAGSYPWTGATADDYALANLGQLKTVFSFDLPPPNPSDTNNNGIPDAWETQMFGDLAHDETADTDGDGISNFDEWQQGTDPNKKDSQALHLEVYVLTSP